MRPVPGAWGGAGEARQLQNLFPSGRGCRGSPAASKPPFSFSVEKEKALFDGVKRKRLGGGIPDFVRNARSALYGGFGLALVVSLDHSTTYGSCESWGPARMPRRSLFAAAPWLLGIAGHLPTESQVVAGDAPLSQKGGGHGLLAVAGGFPAPVPQGGCFQRGGTRGSPLFVSSRRGPGEPHRKGSPGASLPPGATHSLPGGENGGRILPGTGTPRAHGKREIPREEPRKKPPGFPGTSPRPGTGRLTAPPRGGEPSTPPARGGTLNAPREGPTICTPMIPSYPSGVKPTLSNTAAAPASVSR